MPDPTTEKQIITPRPKKPKKNSNKKQKQKTQLSKNVSYKYTSLEGLVSLAAGIGKHCQSI